MKDDWRDEVWHPFKVTSEIILYLLLEFTATTFYTFMATNFGFLRNDPTLKAFGICCMATSIAFAFQPRYQVVYNPSIITGLLVAGRMNIYLGPFLIIAQFCGALVGGGFFVVVHGLQKASRLDFLPGTGVSNAAALFMEMIASFILVISVLRFPIRRRFTSVTLSPAESRKQFNRLLMQPVAMGATRAYLYMMTRYISLAAYNPAIVLTVALITGKWFHVWIYFIGDFSGAILAGLFNYFFLLE